MRFHIYASALLSLAFLILLLGLPHSAFAQPASAVKIGAQSWATRRGVIARVTVNGLTVATLRTPAGGLNPAQRAQGVKQRLVNLADASLTPAQVSLAPLGRQGWEIRGQGRPILLVTPREASAQGLTARHLALVWAGNIKQRLTPLLPSLPFAAQVQASVTVRVTGRPFVPAALVQEALYGGMKRALTAQAGTQMRLLHAPRPVSALRPGQSVTRLMPLRVAGPNLRPVEAAPLVTVINQPLPPVPATALFYSNNPEQVRESRTLFTGPLTLFQPVRLDYHHQNRSAVPLIFHADVVNASARRISVHVIGGVADPQRDTVQVGRRAGAAFLEALDGGIGVVMDVPPHARLPLVVQRFAPGLTVSGILQVQQVTGPVGAMSLSVVADDDRQALVSSPPHLALTAANTAELRLVALPAASEDSGAAQEASPSVFGPPRVSLTGAYAVGGQWEHLPLGNADSLRTAGGAQTFWGNYGVSYFVTVTLSNPTASARTVGVFFAPEAGLAAGVFQISGEPVLQFDPMAPPEEKMLTTVHLSPGAARTVHIRTILLNGSAYPASLVIHAL